MAHHIYKTEGIILATYPRGEADIFFRVFTKDLGLVGATARSVRNIKSKLSFVLQEFSHAEFDLIRGKEIWRLTSAVHTNNFHNLYKHELKGPVFIRTLRLVQRLVVGEGSSPELFAEIMEAYKFLEDMNMSNEDLYSFEHILAMRILAHLGYWGTDEISQNFIDDMWSEELLADFSKHKTKALSAINNALVATHL